MRLFLVIATLFFSFILKSQHNPDLTLKFKEILGHPIIGLGESSHGSKTDYEIRTIIIDHLLREKDSLIILIEMENGIETVISDFLKGKCDTALLIKKLAYLGLQTDSFLNFINKYRDAPIRYCGFDMQLHEHSLKLIKNQLKSIKDVDSIQLIEIFKPLEIELHKVCTLKDSSSVFTKFETNLDILSKVAIKNSHLIDSSSLLYNLQLPLQIVSQSFIYYRKIATNTTVNSRFRDSCMAVNITKVLKRTNQQAVVLGANYHLGNDIVTRTSGYYLKKEFGSRYFIVASQFYAGTILGINMLHGRKIDNQYFVSPRKSLPYKLNKIIRSDYEFIVIKNSTGKLKRILNKKILMQDIGAGLDYHYKNAGYYYSIPSNKYDSILFIKCVVPSKSLVE